MREVCEIIEYFSLSLNLHSYSVSGGVHGIETAMILKSLSIHNFVLEVGNVMHKPSNNKTSLV